MSAKQTQTISSVAEPQQSSRISYVLIILCLGIYILVGILCAAFHAWKTVLACGGGSILLCLPLWLLIRKHFRTSHLSLMAIAVLSVTVIAWVGQGIHDLAIVTYPIILIYAGLISDRYILRTCGLLTFIALTCLAFAEPLGWISPAPIFRDPYNISYLLVATILMAITVVAVEMLSSHLKDSNEKLRQSEQKYGILFNNEVYAIRIVDLETYKIIDVNEAHTRLYGYTKEALSGMSVFDLTAEPEAAKASFSEIAPKGTKYVPLRLNRRKDGTLFPVELAIIPYQLNGREVEAAFIRDISDRVFAENELRESQELIKGLLNSLPEGVFWKDRNLKFLGCNDTFAQDAGYKSPAELVGKDDNQMAWREEAEKYRKDDQEVIDSERPKLNIEETHTSADGITRTLLTSKVPLRSFDGQVRGVVGTSLDISDRKLAEERHRTIIETARDGFWILDAKGHLLEVNDAYCRMSGYSKDELLSMTIVELVEKEAASHLDSHLSQILSTGNDQFQSVHRRKDGTIFDVEVSVQRSAFEKDRFVLFLRDISDRIKADKERLSMEQSLQQMQRLESLGVLAGGIAHDFNNLLMGIFGFTDLAKSEVKDQVVSDYLSQAMESMEKAKGLTQQLLTFSKGGAPVKRLCSVSALLKETCQFALHGSNVKASFLIQENLWHSEIDKNQIGQVIQNLMINAIQAMPLGGTIEVMARNASLRLREHPTLGEGDYVAFAIKDQGIGISKEILPHVFDPFFTTKIRGHGLGLAITHSIVTRHEGAISVESESGMGTTFTVYLPATDGQSQENEAKAEIEHVGVGKILVMDDEEMVRRLLSTMLESLGYTVIAKANGKETLDCFKAGLEEKDSFAAIVLDLTVPGGFGGKEVAEEMRKLDLNVPIFVVSGYAADPIIANPQEFGFTDSISKPFKRGGLMELLEKHIGKGKATQ